MTKHTKELTEADKRKAEIDAEAQAQKDQIVPGAYPDANTKSQENPYGIKHADAAEGEKGKAE